MKSISDDPGLHYSTVSKIIKATGNSRFNPLFNLFQCFNTQLKAGFSLNGDNRYDSVTRFCNFNEFLIVLKNLVRVLETTYYDPRFL